MIRRDLNLGFSRKSRSGSGEAFELAYHLVHGVVTAVLVINRWFSHLEMTRWMVFCSARTRRRRMKLNFGHQAGVVAIGH